MSESRERLVMDTFVELADTLASDYDVTAFLHLLVERCQDVLGVDAGGVLIGTAKGGLGLAAATTEKMRRYEEAEMRHGEGPCIDAFRGVEQIVAEDLNKAKDRWPRAAPEALELGLQAVYAFPLRLRDDCIGALNLYREQPGPFGHDDMRLAQAFADVAAIGILQEREIADKDRTVRQLQHALDSRVAIEQAKGVLAARMGITPEEAFEVLRRHARSNRVKLQEVASGVVHDQLHVSGGG